MDERGRLLGRMNVIDLAAVALICAVVAAAYVRLTAPHRIAPPYPSGAVRAWVEADLRLPRDQTWMQEHLVPGARQLDARNGDVLAEIRAGRLADSGCVVTVRLRALRDGAGRLLYGDAPLVPGRQLRIETESSVVEGWVSRVEESVASGGDDPE